MISLKVILCWWARGGILRSLFQYHFFSCSIVRRGKHDLRISGSEEDDDVLNAEPWKICSCEREVRLE